MGDFVKNKILCVIIFILILIAVLIGIFYSDINNSKNNISLQLEKLQSTYSSRIYKVSDLINYIVKNELDNDIVSNLAKERDSLSMAITDDNIKLMHKRNNKLTNEIEELYKYIDDTDIKDDINYNSLKDDINYNSLKDDINKITNNINKEEKKYNKVVNKYNKKIKKFPYVVFKLSRKKIIK